MGRKRGQKYSEPSAEMTPKKPSLAAIWPEDGLCPLCGREMIPGTSLNDHHLVPKSKGGREKYVIHRVCHSKIHSVFSENELALVHNTFDSLKRDPQIQRFVKWIRKQDPERIVKHRRPAKK